MGDFLLRTFLFIGLFAKGWASNPLFNEQVVRLINELNAMKPILKEAALYQSENEPLKLHLNAFKTSDGTLKNGVAEDLELIKKGLIAYLNKPVIAPNKVQPISGDFVESLKKEFKP